VLHGYPPAHHKDLPPPSQGASDLSILIIIYFVLLKIYMYNQSLFLHADNVGLQLLFTVQHVHNREELPPPPPSHMYTPTPHSASFQQASPYRLQSSVETPPLTRILLQNMLDHMLSIHVRSRVFATLEDAAQFIKSVSMLYDAYVETKNIAKLKVLSPPPPGPLICTCWTC